MTTMQTGWGRLLGSQEASKADLEPRQAGAKAGSKAGFGNSRTSPVEEIGFRELKSLRLVVLGPDESDWSGR